MAQFNSSSDARYICTSNPPSPTSVLGFSSNLLSKLAASRSVVDKFVDEQMKKADEARMSNNDSIRSDQKEVNMLVAKLNDVQSKRGAMSVNNERGRPAEVGIAGRRLELREKQKRMEGKLADLHVHNTERQQELKFLTEKESVQRERAEEVREAKMRVEEMKKMTVEDLTRGILYYHRIGLNFIKGAGDSL
eukprot:10085218-Ditylum_brightwellii.AAC.1